MLMKNEEKLRKDGQIKEIVEMKSVYICVCNLQE